MLYALEIPLHPGMQIAEQRLLPAVRSAKNAVVVASGVSCRDQIGHGARRHALHVIELVAEKLVDRDD